MAVSCADAGGSGGHLSDHGEDVVVWQGSRLVAVRLHDGLTITIRDQR